MSGLDRTPLSESELNSWLANHPGWRYEGGQIWREFAFGGYPESVAFAMGVAAVAQRLDHHPDLLLTYGNVRVAVSTHDADGITGLDFALAAEADRLGGCR
jgi:4a-hydroxytetrahydrobiopterin dehydratase